jgi:hypothetical protein
MDFSEISRSFQQLWEAKPTTVVLLVVGFIGFLVLVVDAWRHKRRRKRPR